MSEPDLLHPIYHVGKLNVSNSVPLSVLVELFKTKDLKEGTFNIYSLIDPKKEAITVFDYPVGMTHEEYKKFISGVQRELDILTNYFNELEVIKVVKSIN